MAAERVTAGEISVAQGDHADIERGFGAIGKSAATADSQFNTGNLSDVIAAIAVMQLSEQGRLKLDGSRYGAGVEGALARLVAAAGENFSAYAQTHIFAPLKMARVRPFGHRMAKNGS